MSTVTKTESFKKRERLFDLYSSQLKLRGVTPTGIFFCPLCGTPFERNALEGKDSILTLAHVVPAALGGKRPTLACKTCNNGNGAQSESALTKWMEYIDWCEGAGKWDARLAIKGIEGDFGIDFRRTGVTSNWSLCIVEKQSNPHNLRALDEWLSKNKGVRNDAITMSFSWSVPHFANRVIAAIRQAAYLLMFRYFGYDFAVLAQYDSLGKRYSSDEDASWSNRIKILDKKSFADVLGDEEAGIMFIREPEASMLLVLRFRRGNGKERVVGVLLPGPYEDRVPAYKVGSLKGSVVRYQPERLSTKRNSFVGLWRQVMRTL